MSKEKKKSLLDRLAGTLDRETPIDKFEKEVEKLLNPPVDFCWSS